MKLLKLEADHLRDNEKTVLFRRVEPQPFVASCSDKMIWIKNLDAGFPRCTGRQWRYQMREHCPLGKPDDTVTTDGGLTLRIVSVEVAEVTLAGGTAWYWRVVVEVAE